MLVIFMLKMLFCFIYMKKKVKKYKIFIKLSVMV